MTDGEKSFEVTLTHDESQKAMNIGQRRHESSESHGYTQSDGSKASNALKNHQRGAAAEIAASKYLEIPWDATVDGYQSVPDIADVLEIRGRNNVRPYLRLKLNDQLHKADRLFVSVERLGNQRFHIDGWIKGSDGMLDIYVVPDAPDSRKPEWHVPLKDLHSPETLQAALRERIGARFDELHKEWRNNNPSAP